MNEPPVGFAATHNSPRRACVLIEELATISSLIMLVIMAVERALEIQMWLFGRFERIDF